MIRYGARVLSFKRPLPSEKSSIESLEVIYQRYIKKLQDSKVKDDGCPLCHRRFEANRQITELIAEVRAA